MFRPLLATHNRCSRNVCPLSPTALQTKIIAVCFILLTSCGGGTAPIDNAWPQKVDGANAAGFSEQGIAGLNAAMEKIVSDKDVAGMVWLLAKDGKVATFEATGLAAIDSNRPMTKDTLFRIYSMTKPITGVAMMILYEYGYWDFDDPVSKFIPEFANLQVMTDYDDDGNVTLEPLRRQPTMRELLNHSAGFGYGLVGNDPVNKAFRDEGVLISKDLDELVKKVSKIPLRYQPGERWEYSIAVDLQGYIIEKISGKTLGEFLETQIFKPLGMSDTRFYLLPQDEERFAEVHNWDEDTQGLVQRPERTDRPPFRDPNRLQSGGGGLVSSTHDYARFLQMLVNGGELDGRRIITAESVKKMTTNTLRDGLLLRGSETRPGQAGQGFGVDFAIIFDPVAAESPQGAGTYYWSGAAGTWFWVDPTANMFWVGMIQAQGARRPEAGDMRDIAEEIIYKSLLH